MSVNFGHVCIIYVKIYEKMSSGGLEVSFSIYKSADHNKGQHAKSYLAQKLIKTKIPKSALSLSDIVFILLINVKMPTIVGILIFMSRINFVLS